MNGEEPQQPKAQKLYTADEVERIARSVRQHERIMSSLLTAIQRAQMAGDDKIYIEALQDVLDTYTQPMPMQRPEPAEPAPPAPADESTQE